MPLSLKKRVLERRATASEPGLGEQMALYRELGFEVVKLEVVSDPESGCRECMGDGQTFVIYTRKKRTDD